MLATGGLLVSIALLTLAALAQVFRNSAPPQWAPRGWIGEVLAVTIICALALGAVHLGAGTIDAMRTGPDYLDLGLLAVVLLASFLIWRGLNTRARRTAVDPDASVGLTAPEDDAA